MTRLKRLAAPRSWSIPRKTHKWAVSASPGSHPAEGCVPLLVIVRDMLHYCDTAREGERIIHGRKIFVDGRAVTDPKYPVGLMDSVSMPDTKESFRMLIDRRGNFRLVPIGEEDAKWKLSRIENKVTIKVGRIQLSLFDGRNILADGTKYRTGDTLKIAVPDQKILDLIPFEKGNIALLIGGQHVGEIGHVEEEKVERSAKPNIVTFREGFDTVRHYVFMVGKEKPEVPLVESSAV